MPGTIKAMRSCGSVELQILGQLYCGRAARGIAVFFGAALISILSGGFLSILAWLAGAWDAYKVAQGDEVKIGVQPAKT